MSKKRTIILAIAAIAILISILEILYLVSRRNDNTGSYFTIMGMGCDAIAYEQDGEIGSLTLNDGVREIIAKVSDTDLQNSLTSEDLSNVIGASVGIDITDEFVEENHLHITDDNDIYRYFYSGTFDGYLVLVEAFGTSKTAFSSIPLNANAAIFVFFPLNTTFFIDAQCAKARLTDLSHLCRNRYFT